MGYQPSFYPPDFSLYCISDDKKRSITSHIKRKTHQINVIPLISERERNGLIKRGWLLLTEIHSTYRRACYELLFPHRLIYNLDSLYVDEQKPRQILKRLKACIGCEI